MVKLLAISNNQTNGAEPVRVPQGDQGGFAAGRSLPHSVKKPTTRRTNRQNGL